MNNTNFYQLPDSEKVAIFQEISNVTGMPMFAVEKDWWVVKTLSLIFEMEVGKHLVFKGGTSLSKAFKIIDRFSEDVDLAIDRQFLNFKNDLSKKEITELRKAANKYISGSFFEELQSKFIENGLEAVELKLVETTHSDQDPRIIEVYYPNLIQNPGYIEPRVQIEIGCRSLKEPFSIQTFGSLIDENASDMPFAEPLIHIPTVNPERTFLEKIFLLHEEFQKPKDKIRVDRLSRHLFDIVKLSKTEFADKALNNLDLYNTIIEHRIKFTKLSGIDYALHQPKTINPIPPMDFIDAWKADYTTMKREMIYERNPPSFEQIITDLIELKRKINALG